LDAEALVIFPQFLKKYKYIPFIKGAYLLFLLVAQNLSLQLFRSDKIGVYYVLHHYRVRIFF
jgi:hypothetical protein